jgi:uncharacterized protein
MIVGKYNRLRIDRFVSIGAYLVDKEGNDVLLPNKYILPDFELDDEVDVYVYKDYEHRLIATTLQPYIQRDEFALLQVAHVSEVGAFMECGLEKQLLIPFREQPKHLEVEKRYMVHMYLDEATQRLVGTTRIARHLSSNHNLMKGDEVDALIWERTDLGFRVIINNYTTGLLFNSEAPKNLRIGDKKKMFVKNVREDGKIDLSILQEGYEKIDSLSNELLSMIERNDGFLDLSDKSSPEEIFKRTGWSKKVFKQTVGKLYKERKILISDNGISLI